MDGCRKLFRQETSKKIKLYKDGRVDKLRHFSEIISCYHDIIYYAKRMAYRIIHWKGQNDTIESPAIMLMNEDRLIRGKPIRTSFDIISPSGYPRHAMSSMIRHSMDSTVKTVKHNKIVPYTETNLRLNVLHRVSSEK